MTNAISGNKRRMEYILGLPPKALKSPPGFAKDGTGRRGHKPIPSDEELKTKTFAELMAMLSAKKARFVSEVLKGTPNPQAIAAAGWHCKDGPSSHTRAGQLRRNDPVIRAALAAARAEVAEEVKYSIAEAFKDFKDAAVFAKETKNATALVRSCEMQAKLFGHLVDRQDVRQLAALTIAIEGLD
jgi:hypothetical protein